jgi:hypothetical protein
MATYVRAGLPEVATALAALTGEPHPLAISACPPDSPFSDHARPIRHTLKDTLWRDRLSKLEPGLGIQRDNTVSRRLVARPSLELIKNIYYGTRYMVSKRLAA